MSNVMLMYHPVKKEIHFLTNDNGEYNEIPYEDCPKLQLYAPDQGEFFLQNQGNKFFDDIADTFLGLENNKVIFKGTKLDYEDFVKMVNNYNNYKGKKVFNLGEFIELPEVSTIYNSIMEFSNDSMEIFDLHLKDINTRAIFEKRHEDLIKKIEELNNNNVNLCMVGTYSSGKSTFINAIIGKRILPECINSETAKMFKIQNSKCPSVNFIIKKDKQDNGSVVSIIWDEKHNMFTFTTTINDDGVKGKIDKVMTDSKSKMQHEQLHDILKELNGLPNETNEDAKNYLHGIIEVNYPINLCDDINFTFFDTPGTDSNSAEHLEVLKDALQKQTNSILIILYSPAKMEGTGNSILYKLLEESQDNNNNENNVTIDLSRSLHIINQVDRFKTKELNDIQNKKIKASLNKNDEVNDEEDCEIEYDLRKKRVFYVSSRGAYCAKAALEGIQDEDDEEFIDDEMNKIISRQYFKYDNLAESETETYELKESSKLKLDKCEDISDEEKRKLEKLYISSGMFAIEEEIVKYAKKYALAVKAKGLYDGVVHIIEGVEQGYEALESQASKSKEEIINKINIMKNDMKNDILQCYYEFCKYLSMGDFERHTAEIESIHNKISYLNEKAGEETDKMPKFSSNEDKLKEKNKAILETLNSYARDIDRFYNEKRVVILNKQMKALKAIISKKIIGYKDKGIGDELLKQILNIPETKVSSSSLKSIEMDKYINKYKAFFLFTTTNKREYKEEVTKNFISLTLKQYDRYIDEVKDVAREKGKEVTDGIIDNIEILSSSLENLIQDKEKVSAEQLAAKEVLNIVKQKRSELDKEIWRSIDE